MASMIGFCQVTLPRARSGREFAFVVLAESLCIGNDLFPPARRQFPTSSHPNNLSIFHPHSPSAYAADRGFSGGCVPSGIGQT